MFRVVMVLVVALWTLSCQGGNDNQACREIDKAAANFVQYKQARYWNELGILTDKPNTCECKTAVVAFHFARLSTELPNSHALIGISPTEHVKKLRSEMNRLVEVLRNCKKEDYAQILVAMEAQTFDADVSDTAMALTKTLHAKSGIQLIDK